MVTFATRARLQVAGYALTRMIASSPNSPQGGEKDLSFAAALVREGLIDPGILADRIGTVAAHPLVIEKARGWIASNRQDPG